MVMMISPDSRLSGLGRAFIGDANQLQQKLMSIRRRIFDRRMVQRYFSGGKGGTCRRQSIRLSPPCAAEPWRAFASGMIRRAVCSLQ
jgi:hypothetical protein